MVKKYNAEDIVDHHGVAAVIKNDQDEVLMQDHVKFGFWTIPVGKVMAGDDIVAGLNQEILEECNITVLESKELTTKDYAYERDGKNVHVVSHLYEITKYEGEIKNNEPQKHTQQLFLPISKIEKLPYLSDSTILYLDYLGIKRDAKL